MVNLMPIVAPIMAMAGIEFFSGISCAKRDIMHWIIIYIAHAAIRTEKIRIPTTCTRDLPKGYFDKSSLENEEWAAVQERIIPAIISRQESVRDEIIVYDDDEDLYISYD